MVGAVEGQKEQEHKPVKRKSRRDLEVGENRGVEGVSGARVMCYL